MSIPFRCFAAFCLLGLAFTFPAAGAELAAPVLVKDFVPGDDPLSFDLYHDISAAGGRIFFGGADSDHGREPWVSDGTPAGTRRLADTCSGNCDGNGRAFTQIGDRVVFLAAGGLYRAVGESAELYYPADDFGLAHAELGSLLYLTRGEQMVVTDGTREGTHEIGDLGEPCPGTTICPAAEVFAKTGGKLVYVHGGRLYAYAPGGAPEVLHYDLPGGAFGFANLADGRLIFAGCAAAQGSYCRAYATDGTRQGTVLLEPDGHSGLATLGALEFVVFRERAYFVAYDAASPYSRRLMSTDGTPAGTRDETSHFPGEPPRLLAATGTHLYFTLREESDEALYSLDRNGLRTRLLADSVFELVGRLGESIFFNHGHGGGIGYPAVYHLATSDGGVSGTFDFDGLNATGSTYGSAVLGDSLYFGRGGHLWRTDGRPAGTFDLLPDARTPRSSYPVSYAQGDALLTETSDPTLPDQPHFLWRIDPESLAVEAVAGGQPLQVLAAGRDRALVAEGPYADSRDYGLRGLQLEPMPFSGQVRGTSFADDGHFFFFSDVFPGQQLWESDGTAAGTRLLLDFSNGAGCEIYCNVFGTTAASGDLVFFWAQGEVAPPAARLSVWDRRLNEKRVLLETTSFLPEPLALPGGRALFIESRYPEPGATLWISDGTTAGTRTFFSLPAGETLGTLTVAGSRLFFATVDAGGNSRLWHSDLSTAGTLPIVTFPSPTQIGSLIAAGERIFFAADAGQGAELGFSDGSAAGTRIFDLNPGPAGSRSDPDFQFLREALVTADQRLVFGATGDAAGRELWVSDGSVAGTFRLTDLNPGPAASNPAHLAQLGNRLFFQASDGELGSELWALAMPPARPPCRAENLCFAHGRFEASVVAHAANGDFQGRREIANEASGVFSFFSSANWEMLAKVLDGCALNGHYWVFAAAATDVPFTLTVRDREQGRERTWSSPAGPARAITDIAAFPCD